MAEENDRGAGIEELAVEAESQQSLDGAIEQLNGKHVGHESETLTGTLAQVEEGAAVVEADIVHVESGAVGKAIAGSIDVQEGAIGIAQGSTITVHDGAIGVAFVERAEVHDGTVLFMLAEEVSGETNVLFDLRAAVLFGVIVGVVSGVIKLLSGRKGD